MEIFNLLQESPFLLITVVTIVGLLVGSFLNVVIYRLPVMMEAAWRAECLDYLELPAEEMSETLNLILPASRCPHCKNAIKAYQNIPVISYVLLRGKCAHCQQAISVRYPLIEFFTGLCSAIVAFHFGYGEALIGALILTWGLIALSFIDIDKFLLPDSIVLPLLWLGLFLNLFQIYVPLDVSVIGAIAGYMVLWSVFWLFKLVTGKEGMGQGDFKLLAMLGAWLGWQSLPMIILLSSVVGASIGISMIIFAGRERNAAIPFGPYLAAAGWITLIWEQPIGQLYSHLLR